MRAETSAPATVPEPGDDALQFDRVEPAAPDAFDAPDAPAGGVEGVVTCSGCRARVADAYWSVEGAPHCAACTDAVRRIAAPVREWPLLLRALVFGLGAAIAGAALYYGVIAITDFEIGLVAIACGWMVGTMVRRGARGRGGRRLQVAAVALTYVSVALAYLPLALQGAAEGPDAGAAAGIAADSARAAADSLALSADPAAAGGAEGDGGSLALALLLAAGFTLALPVLAIVGSLPGGLLSALIIGVGMQQAWRMTAAPEPAIHGPYRVGGGVRAPDDGSPVPTAAALPAPASAGTPA